MATTITAGNATNGAAISSDNTGILELKSGTGSGTTAVTVSTGQAVTFAQTANLPNTFGFKNRIINGDMRIDQRNAGASVTVNSTAAAYPVDRWYGQGEATDGVFTLQQSTDAPAGFIRSLKATVTTADASIGSSQVYRFIQRIEGNNLADLNLGLSSASAFTISFWVKSSVTGTFGGSLWGASATEWYVFSYTINSANTWEYKTVNVPARTSGSFDVGTGIGLQLQFSLGAGSSRLTTAGSWINGATEYYGVTGQTNLIGTLNATWFITGVQLEKGSTATSFDVRPYGTELQLAQRYYQHINPTDTQYVSAGRWGSNAIGFSIPTIVSLRASPTIASAGTFSVTGNAIQETFTSPSIGSWSTSLVTLIKTGLTNNPSTTQAYTVNLPGTSTNYVSFSSEL